jgi:hypothetical protein
MLERLSARQLSVLLPCVALLVSLCWLTSLERYLGVRYHFSLEAALPPAVAQAAFAPSRWLDDRVRAGGSRPLFRLAWPSANKPIEFTGLTSLFAVPARSADFNNTSAWNTFEGPETIFLGVKRIRLPLLSTALRIWMRSCSSEVCERLAAVESWFENVPVAIG